MQDLIIIYTAIRCSNKDKTQPGVVILPQAEEKYGHKAIEAHILRRCFVISIYQTSIPTNTVLILLLPSIRMEYKLHMVI
jgi:hypothetical protein